MRRVAPALAGGLWVGVVVAVGASIAVALGAEFDASVGVLGAVSIVFVTAGALIVYRADGNTVGWMLLAVGIVIALTITAQAVQTDAASALTDLTYWVGIMSWAPLVALLMALPSVFPTGRVLPGWPPLHIWAGVGFVTSAVVLNGFAPSLEEPEPNPFANTTIDRLGAVAGLVVAVCIITLLAFGALSLFAQYRRGSSIERQQIKWFSFAAALMFPAMALADATQDTVGPLILVLAATAFPIAIAVAITRYRLYEIDRIINRTMVYAIVVGLLGAVFVVGAVWLPSVLPFGNNNVAVAVSTLAVFFLFNPVRRRVQRFVDRRFYRSRYDAQQVADEFSVRLRDQVDPDVVAAEWAGLVQRTLQPAAVSVWVREEGI